MTAQSVLRLIPNGRRLSPEELATRQHWLTVILGGHIPVLMIIGLTRGYSLDHLLLEVATPLATLTFISLLRSLDTVLRAIVTTTGLAVSSSILIHLTDGLIESHFHFFVLVPLVTLYQHWTPFLVTIGWVLFHHGVIGVIDPESVYNHPAAVASPVKWALVHTVFVVGASLASIVSWRRNQDERERTELLLEASAQPLYGRDRQGRITMASRSLADLLGSTTAEVVGSTDHELLHAEPADGCRVCARIADGTAEELEDPHFLVGGQELPVEISSRRVAPGGAFDGVVVSFCDVTIRRAHERELRHRALHDQLTGLANRTLVIDRMMEALGRVPEEGGLVGALYIDLDDFKLVNDTHGHAVGDRLLIEMARRLRRICRDGDTPGRIGGDEFVVVLSNLSSTDEAERVAERVVERLSAPYVDGGLTLTVGASVGIQVTGDATRDPKVVLREADDALYASKARNRGGITRFDDAMRSEAARELQMVRLLRRAVERHELSVVYQPQVDLRSGRVIGFEALCRWRTAELGEVSPVDFIPLAERIGVIDQLGSLVLTEAVGQLALWCAATGRHDLRVSVNVSSRQLTDRAIVDQVRSELARHSIRPAQLVVEVTEAAVVEPESGSLGRLAELRDHGVSVAVDDFGTGSSSLARLRTLPADQLKIDRGFIIGLADHEKNRELVRVVVAMAGILGLEVTAEGTESEADLEIARQLGCDLVQGYAISRPVPPDEIGQWLDDRRILAPRHEPTPESTVNR